MIKQDILEFELLDYRTGPYYRKHHIIRTLWRPIIGMAGMDLYDFYVQESVERSDGTRLVRVSSEIIIKELDIGEATLTDMNFVLEWCQLILIPNRTKREINQVYLVNPKHLVKEVSLDLHYMGYIVPVENQITLDELKKTITKGTAPRKIKSGRKTKGKYRLRATLYKHIGAWLPPQERRKKFAKGLNVVVKQPIIPLKVKDIQRELPLNGHDSAHDQLIIDLVASFDGLTEDQALHIVEQYGIDTVRQQLDWLPNRVSDGYAPLQTFRASLKGDWAVPESAPEPETWHGGELDPVTSTNNGNQPPETEPATEPVAEPETELQKQWAKVLERVQESMTQTTYDGWLRNTTLERIEGNVWVVGCETSFVKDWLENRLIEVIRRTVQSVSGSEVELKFVVKEAI